MKGNNREIRPIFGLKCARTGGGKTNRLHPIFDDKEAGNRPVTVRFPASLLASGAVEGRSELQSIPYA